MLRQKTKSEILILVLLLLMMVGIMYSKFLLSVSMILIVITAIVKWFRSDIKLQTQAFKPFAAISLLFILILFSGINSEDISEWVHHLRIKLPFLLLPPSFYILKEEISGVFTLLTLSFLALISLSTIPIVLQFFSSDSIIEQIGKGQSIETPVDHIKYSLFLAFGIFIAVYGSFKQNVVPRSVAGVIAVYLVLILHLLAVRSGLAVFYLCSIILLMRYIIVSGKKLLLLLLVPLFLLPIVTINLVPSLKKKMEYMAYDLKMFRSGEGSMYSDSERLYSAKVGFELFKENILWGTGIGDLKTACIEKSKAILGTAINKYPHNQFLFFLAGTGLFGLLLFLFGFYYPVIYYWNRLEFFFLTMILIMSFSFIVENTIERSYSIGFLLLFLLASMCKMSEESTPSPE